MTEYNGPATLPLDHLEALPLNCYPEEPRLGGHGGTDTLASA